MTYKEHSVMLSRPPSALTEELFAQMREAGITGIEVSPKQHEFDALELLPIKELADRYGITLWSFHLRFCDFEGYDIANLNEAGRRHAIEYAKAYIKKAAEVGIGIAVIHPSGEPIEDSDRAEKLRLAKSALAELAEYAARLSVTLAVEDLPRTCLGNCSAELLELIAADSRLRICFDTNHLLGEDISDFIRACGEKILTVHFSDYDFVNERHWLPGEGQIDWAALMDTLDSVGYDGPILYEVPMSVKGLKSIVRSRDLTAFDMKRNAEELMARTALTVHGHPIEDLPFWCM